MSYIWQLFLLMNWFEKGATIMLAVYFLYHLITLLYELSVPKRIADIKNELKFKRMSIMEDK